MTIEKTDKRNAGRRLWDIQCAQGTQLCIGLDLHHDHDPEADPRDLPQLVQLYNDYHSLAQNLALDYGRSLAGYDMLCDGFHDVIRNHDLIWGRKPINLKRAIPFINGMIAYTKEVIYTAWGEGIRVFKIQMSFMEALSPVGNYVLEVIVAFIQWLAARDGEECFIILDCKRGDIFSTQEAYYRPYLAALDEEIFPGVCGRYDFDMMTVNAWMGTDVLDPGLKWFKRGKGAIVVNNSSNPTGPEFQDLVADVAMLDGELDENVLEATRRLKRKPTVADMMLFRTEAFCRRHSLNDADGFSPIFSVMGSTNKFDDTFRILRPSGTALIPGFGHQGGPFANVMPLAAKQYPRTGQIGICSSSRVHMYPWMPKYGGQGDPMKLRDELKRAIAQFKTDERAAYEAAGIVFPFLARGNS
ncbi:MAG: orotidine 5'-phosphate decarboxylase / HUMPS family protein [Patescibacteria group bacterium]